MFLFFVLTHHFTCPAQLTGDQHIWNRTLVLGTNYLEVERENTAQYVVKGFSRSGTLNDVVEGNNHANFSTVDRACTAR